MSADGEARWARRRSTPSACFSSAQTNAAHATFSSVTQRMTHTASGTSSTRRTRGPSGGGVGGRSGIAPTLVGVLRPRQGSVSVRVLGSVLCLLLVVLLLSAAQAPSPVRPDVVAGGVVALIGLWGLSAAKKLYEKLNMVLDGYPDMQTALWGPRDAAGNRPVGGLVRQTQEIQLSLERIEQLAAKGERALEVAQNAELAATTAVEAVKHLQGAQRRRRTSGGSE